LPRKTLGAQAKDEIEEEEQEGFSKVKGKERGRSYGPNETKTGDG